MARGVVIVPKVDIISIDSMLEETHTLTNTVTDHPVESGFNISDHSRPDPDQVTLRCFVSNTPASEVQMQNAINSGAQAAASTTTQQPIAAVDGYGALVYAKLKQLRGSGQLVQVVTAIETYGVSSNGGMTITGITIPRTKENYDGLEFSITLKQIRVVQNRSTTDTKQKTKKARPKINNGSKPTTPATSDDNSLLDKAYQNKDGLASGLKSALGSLGGGG